MDGFAGDACAKLGIGYEDQKKVKPDIIYTQCTGYGAHGPYAQIPTHGMMMGALAGLFAQWGIIRMFQMTPKQLLRWGVVCGIAGNLLVAIAPDFNMVVAGYALAKVHLK